MIQSANLKKIPYRYLKYLVKRKEKIALKLGWYSYKTIKKKLEN